jgi:hypothetical protein
MRQPENRAGHNPCFPLSGQNPRTLNAKAARTLAGKTAKPASEVHSITRRRPNHSRIDLRRSRAAKGGFRFHRRSGGPLLDP